MDVIRWGWMLRVIKCSLGRHVSHLLRRRFIRDCEANKRQIFFDVVSAGNWRAHGKVDPINPFEFN